MKEQTTLQDLINLCLKNNVNPTDVVLLLRQPCESGEDQIDFLCNPQILNDKEALNLKDEFINIPIAIAVDNVDIYFNQEDI